jgi:hypothetical protein
MEGKSCCRWFSLGRYRAAATKQFASEAAIEHTRNSHAPEQEKNSANKTVKLNASISAAH